MFERGSYAAHPTDGYRCPHFAHLDHPEHPSTPLTTPESAESCGSEPPLEREAASNPPSPRQTPCEQGGFDTGISEPDAGPRPVPAACARRSGRALPFSTRRYAWQQRVVFDGSGAAERAWYDGPGLTVRPCGWSGFHRSFWFRPESYQPPRAHPPSASLAASGPGSSHQVMAAPCRGLPLRLGDAREALSHFAGSCQYSQTPFRVARIGYYQHERPRFLDLNPKQGHHVQQQRNRPHGAPHRKIADAAKEAADKPTPLGEEARSQ